MFNQSSLKQIGLTKNNLYGKLPGNICDNLPDLEALALSSNRFDGLIPPNLQNCSKLQILSLSQNDFTGTIPTEIGNLTMLTALQLGVTYLKGIIFLCSSSKTCKCFSSIYFPSKHLKWDSSISRAI